MANEDVDKLRNFVMRVLPRVSLCKFGYEGYERFVIYAAPSNCPALIPSQKTSELAWKKAADILGYRTWTPGEDERWLAQNEPTANPPYTHAINRERYHR